MAASHRASVLPATNVDGACARICVALWAPKVIFWTRLLGAKTLPLFAGTCNRDSTCCRQNPVNDYKLTDMLLNKADYTYHPVTDLLNHAQHPQWSPNTSDYSRDI